MGGEGIVVTRSEKACGQKKNTRIENADEHWWLSAVLESTYDGIFITDGEGYYITANRGFERITGVRREDMVGKHVTYMVEKGWIPFSVSMETLRRKAQVTKLVTYPTGVEALVTGIPVLGENGRVVAAVCNIRDLTELNKLREEVVLTRKLAESYKKRLVELQGLPDFGKKGIIAKDPGMQRVLCLADKVAESDATVLITGESGVGKGVVAKYIHQHSPRSATGTFVKVDCGAIPAALLESELFGYERGAFTDAKREGKPGLFEVADKGTLFLDEIGELPLALQAKLLNVLQDKEIKRVGGIRVVPVDVRIIAASNRDLEDMVRKKEFREDLYYRLSVVPINIPPLRERRDDLLPLIAHFLNRYNAKYGTNKNISPSALDCLIDYHWPGNVRELENTIERLVLVSNGDTIQHGDLPEKIKRASAPCEHVGEEIKPLKAAIEDLEKRLIRRALDVCPTVGEAARALGVDMSTLTRKRQKYRLL